MSFRRFAALAVALAIGTGAQAEPPPPATRLPEMVTLDDALRIFRAHGIDLLIADAAVQSAQADARAAAIVPNPQLGGSVGRSFLTTRRAVPAAPISAWSASISDNSALMDTASGRRHLRMKVADEALRAARLERGDAQRQLELQLKQQYIEAVLARDTLDFALEVQASQAKMLELNQIRYKAGAISETDVAKVETAKLEADQDVDRATQNLRAAKLAVAFLPRRARADPRLQDRAGSAALRDPRRARQRQRRRAAQRGDRSPPRSEGVRGRAEAGGDLDRGGAPAARARTSRSRRSSPAKAPAIRRSSRPP